MSGERGDNGGERVIGNSESVIDLLPVAELNAGVRYADMLPNRDREGVGLIFRLDGVQSSYRL